MSPSSERADVDTCYHRSGYQLGHRPKLQVEFCNTGPVLKIRRCPNEHLHGQRVRTVHSPLWLYSNVGRTSRQGSLAQGGVAGISRSIGESMRGTINTVLASPVGNDSKRPRSKVLTSRDCRATGKNRNFVYFGCAIECAEDVRRC